MTTSRLFFRIVLTSLPWGLFALAGCAGAPRMPAPLEQTTVGDETTIAFDTNHDRRPDFWEYQFAAGVKHAIALADQDGQPGERIELSDIPAADCPHLMILLDGVPFAVVQEMYAAGHFRFFRPPARVICCFPSMTDLALNDLLHAGQGLAFEASYYDRDRQRMSDANDVYLSGENAPWTRLVDYKASYWWDVLVYLDPHIVFEHELAGMRRALSRHERGDVLAYSVGTAGLGTRGGKPAMEAYLAELDRFCEQLIHDYRGRIKLTLAADHGHDLVENRLITFDDALSRSGYRVSDRIRTPRDVIAVQWGLVTYAAFFTDDPAGVAECLRSHPDVDFVCYPWFDAVIVDRGKEYAEIHKTAGGYTYDARQGDPLGLLPIIEQLRQAGHVQADGTIDEAALFAATVQHTYPDPLARLWTAFFDEVKHPPDVVANLRDGVCCGSPFFVRMIGKVASTHGGLNQLNSTTFVMTTLGDLPEVMRSSEVLPALHALSGASAPAAK